MKTKDDIIYDIVPCGIANPVTTIPKGIPVEPATNLPKGGWWVKPWADMTEQESAWMHNYGFLLTDNEVEL